MNQIYKMVIVTCYLIINIFNSTQCGTLLGRANTNYTTTHNIFRSGQSAIGVVRMNNGFTVATPASGVGSTHGSIAFMDTCLSVSGAIDLRDTNTIFLLEDLTLDNSLTFSPSGGKIYGYDRALILKGDLNIPANSCFHIGGRIIIEGQGNTINIDPNSKFLIDTDATLTLRNLILKNTKNQPGNPCLQCSTLGSKICLDNVILSLSDDFYFNCGQLFINNDVTVSGTSKFIYTSPSPCFITPSSTFYFEPKTTFEFKPSTTGTPELPAKDLLIMQDKTSQLYLDGCSLNTTLTGMRLTKGQLILDNKVSITSNIQPDLTEFYNSGNPIISSASYGGTINNLSWSPDGRYIAIGGWTTQTIQVFKFTATNLTKIAESTSYGGTIYGLSWSSDGRFIACGGNTTNTIIIYKFNETTLTKVAESKSYGDGIRTLSWSSDDKYIAIGGWTTQTVQVHQFTGKSLVKIAESANYGGTILSVKWNADGKHIACGGATTNKIIIYRFSGTTLTQVADTASYSYTIECLSWSPDNKYITIGTDSVGLIEILQFTGTKLIHITSTNYGAGLVYNISWSPNGSYIACGGSTNNTAPIKIYKISGNTLSLVAQSESHGTGVSSNISAMTWNSTGRYLAVVGGYIQTLDIYNLRFVSSSPQAISNSIIFGNSALGSNYDLNVRVLADANINVDGILSYDNVN